MSTLDEPITRQELYLSYLNGNTDITLPEPITRIDRYLYALCMNGSAGGGGEGTSNYNNLFNLPSIEGITLKGNKILSDFGIQPDGETIVQNLDGTMSAKGNGMSGTTNYPDLDNLPQINGVTLKGNKTLEDIGAQPEGNYLTEIPENYVTQQKMEGYAQPKGEYATTEDLEEYTLKEKAGVSIVLQVDPQTYVMYLALKNSYEQVISSQEFDFPIETAFVNVDYDENTNKMAFILQNGVRTKEIDLSNIVRGLVPDDRAIAGLDLKSDITAAQLKNVLGLGNVDNTADKDKSVKYATNAGTASKVANTLTFTGGASGSYDGSKTTEIKIPNASVDILSTKEQVEANTTPGKVADALVTRDMIMRWSGCWIAFEDAEGNPTDEPYIHWYGEE